MWVERRWSVKEKCRGIRDKGRSAKGKYGGKMGGGEY